jgi:hypothetical protein
MAAFEDNVILECIPELHQRIIHHPLMLWMAAAPDGIVHQLMSMIKSHVWNQQRAVVCRQIFYCCIDIHYIPCEG